MSCPFTFTVNLKKHIRDHIKCAIIKDDIFIFVGSKMAKIHNVGALLLPSPPDPEHKVELELAMDVPHFNSTPFVIKESLFVVGGCDKDLEPFSDILRFEPDTQEWKYIGRTTVSRYGASAVVFTDRNNQLALFIAGGFKGEKDPCSVIEKVSVVIADDEKRGEKRRIILPSFSHKANKKAKQ